MRHRVIALALMFIASAVVNAQTPMPSIQLPAALDRVLRDYERAWVGRDPKALADLFTEDGFVLASGKQPVRGRTSIREAYASAGGALVLRAFAYETSGNVGYIIGGYGDGTSDTGKFILAVRRVKGRWLIAADIDNSNRRPQPPPQPAPQP